MLAYKEIINNKTDINRIIGILSNLKYKTEVIILSMDESLSDNKSDLKNKDSKDDFIFRLLKHPIQVSQNMKFLSRDEIHER